MSNALNLRRFLRATEMTLRLAGGGILVAALSACHEERPPPPPAVVLAQPVHSDSAAALSPLRFPAEAAPRYANAMSFRVAGKLVERRFRLGDQVKKGEIVARLDPVDAEKQLAGAQAALTAAEHRWQFARQQLDRDTAQAAQNLIATSQLEQTQDAFVAAQSARDQAAAQLAVARDQLDYHGLVADHDGVIASENADTGQVVAAGQPVYVLAWSGDIDAVLDVAAADLGRVAVGQPAQVGFLALPDRLFAAQVREISPAADPLSRTYRVKLTLSEPGPAVRLGMTGEATLAAVVGSGAPPAFKLPATAIFHDGAAPAVFVVRASDSTLELRPVTTYSHGASSSVVTSGLDDGDVVVLAGVHTVYSGERVTAVRPLFDGEGDIVGPTSKAPGQGESQRDSSRNE